MIVVSDATEVRSDDEVLFFEETPEELVVWKEVTMLRLFAVVCSQEGDVVGASR